MNLWSVRLSATWGTKLNVASFGYDQGVMGGFLTLPSFVATFTEIDIDGTAPEKINHFSTIQGISVASYNLGPSKTIFAVSAIMAIGAALQSSAFSLSHIIVGRIMTDISNGLNTFTVPTSQSETSKAHRRGQMVIIEGALITGSICLFPIVFQIVFALIIIAFILELPESLRVLAALGDLPPNDPYIHAEFTAIKDRVLEAAQSTFKDIFTRDENRHLYRVVLAYVNQIFQQISGINLITYYAAQIYEQYIGRDGFTSRILAAANGTEYFLASWIAVFTIERFGRRSLMLFGAAGMATSRAVLAGSISVERTGAGITVPLWIRASANALSTGANWAFNVKWDRLIDLRSMVVMITPVALENLGYQTYTIFAVINAFITAYRSLEEMDTIFHKTTSIFNCVSIARNEPRRYGKNGEVLINYEEAEEMERRSNVAAQGRVKREAMGEEQRMESGAGESGGSSFIEKAE
ncbi:general substrate transporter [Zopfia rhizophila CBS 207.26]|uniref:General substrate transporter n=1 Tax=Zopfia rhizophila CBS 207.26 TaxID=1314779 RepID=A0A6A6E671_9PEZI|nr:general substrate transporter [Zopfia rhizophila CBS 207.26]